MTDRARAAIHLYRHFISYTHSEKKTENAFYLIYYSSIDLLILIRYHITPRDQYLLLDTCLIHAFLESNIYIETIMCLSAPYLTPVGIFPYVV